MNKNLPPIIATLRNYPSFPVDPTHLEETIIGATAELRQVQVGRKTNFLEFYKIQLRFISLKVWAVQLLIIMGMGIFLHSFLQHSDSNIQLGMMASITAPLLVIAGLKTMTRSLNCHMLEIELSTYHLLEKLTIVRMSLLGMVDLIWLTLLGVLLSLWTGIEILDLFFYLLVPFNLACFGCLWLLNRIQTPNCGYYCLLYCGLLLMMQVILSFNPSFWLFDSTGITMVLLLLSTLGVVFELVATRKSYSSLKTASS